MTDETPKAVPNGEPEPQVETPAQEPEKKTPEAIPYDRFKEVLEERNQMKDRLAALEAKQKQADEERLKEENKYKELYEQREKELQQERAERMRLTVATSKGLPPELAARLRGETQEELEADADSLLALMKPASKGVPVTTSGGKVARLDIKNMSPEEIRANKEKLLQQERH